MLVAPHQFGSPAYLAIQSHLDLWGMGVFLLGLFLLLSVVMTLPRPFEVVAHLATGSSLVLLAGGLAMAGSLTGLINFGSLGIGVSLAPFLPRRHGSPRDSNRELLVVVSGLGAAITGAAMLLLPEQFQTPVNASFNPYLFIVGSWFLAGGVLGIRAHLYPIVGRRMFVASHLLLGGALLCFFIVSSLPLKAWLGMAYYGGFGLLILSLPWTGSLIRGVDPSALQTRLALALALAAVLPLVTAMVIISNQQEQVVSAETLAVHKTLAATVADGVKDHLEFPRAVVLETSRRPGLPDMSPDQQAALLRQLAQNYPQLGSFATYDRNGNPVARADQAPPQAIAGSPVFEEARRTGAVATEVQTSPRFQQPVVTLGAPVIASDGSFAGVVVIAVAPSKLTDLLERADPGQGTIVSLVDEKGRVVAQSMSEEANQPLADLSQTPPVAAALATPPGEEGSIRYGQGGGEHLAGIARVPEMDWGVVVDSASATALAAVHGQRDTAFALMLGCLTLALVAGAVVAHQLALPLNVLGRALDQFSRGDLTVPIPRSSVTQISQLAEAFREMRDSLTARTREREGLMEEVARRVAVLDATLQSITDGIIIYSPTGEQSYMNPGAETILGGDSGVWELPLSERTRAIGLHTPEGHPFPPEETPAARALQGEVVRAASAMLIRPDGSQSWLSINAAPIRTPDGRLLGAVATMVDITRERELQEMREDLVRAVSHDLRNPLTAVLGQAQMLERALNRIEGEAKARMLNSVQVVITAGKRMNVMITDLAESIRIESGQIELDAQAIDLVDFVVDLVHRSFETMDTARIRVEMLEQMPMVWADPNRLERILVNLLSNALKYSLADSEVLIKGTAERRR